MVQIPLSVDGLVAPIVDLNVSVSINHPRTSTPGGMALQSPSGTWVSLTNGLYTGAFTFDDAVGNAVGLLSDFDGEDPNGTWHLLVQDSLDDGLAGQVSWRRLGTYETRNAADYALFMAYERSHIPAGSEMRVVERRRATSTPPPQMETKYFVVYRPPGESQREMGPYDTRNEAEYALFMAYERGQIPPGSRPTVQERQVPVE